MNKYRIFFQNRCLTICEGIPDLTQDINGIIYHNAPSVAEAVEEFLAKENILSLYLPCENVDFAWNEFRSLFTEVNAGGGIIKRVNRNDGRIEYLMIYRLGVWDLPKGKQEQGEDISQTALREVQEECGIPEPELLGARLVTHHTYHRDGKFYLKHTHWFDMELDSDAVPVPQTEEDISQAVWVPSERIGEKLINTYPSIREVFESISDN
ncbi:MAG: NUDIX domain-containing protein [Alistipes sp.]|nr:NUDIX domain-containing protein [Candidatus Minthomonas equi]